MSLLNYFGNTSSPKKPPLKKRKLDVTSQQEAESSAAVSHVESTEVDLTEEEKQKRIEENRKKAMAVRKEREIERKLQHGIPSFLTEPSWRNALMPHMKKGSFLSLIKFLDTAKQAGDVIFPPDQLIFNALNSCPIDKISVVILGQDPYHSSPKQAMGMSFSVQTGVNPPPSLQNMYKELKTDIEDFVPPKHGNLQEWASQGVLLLNTVLTVKKKSPNSHQQKGWEPFTDSIISLISDRCEHVVFLLWGSKAKQKSSLINKQKHLILSCPHPSPYSADRGFFGCRHFSKANTWLQGNDLPTISWKLSETPPPPPKIELPTTETKLPATIGLKRKFVESEADPALPKTLLLPKKEVKKGDEKGNPVAGSSSFSCGKVTIECIQGDMVKQTVDVMVNAANALLMHAGGLARAIEVAGGDAIRKESAEWVKLNGHCKIGQVATTTSGNLDCKMIFHTVGPNWKEETKEETKLSLVVRNCLKEAENVLAKSIAFPAISTGLYEYPVDQCAKVMISTTKQFIEQIPPNHSLENIKFILFDHDTFISFMEEAKKCFTTSE